jgi:hypothetical protein
MGGGISLASPGHTYTAGVATPRGVISSLHCNGSACNTGHATSAWAICTATSPRAFKTDFNAPSSSAFNADSFIICIAATECGVIPSPYCTVISIAAIRCAAITTTKDIASRRLGFVYDMPKTLPSQNVLSLLDLQFQITTVMPDAA